MDSNVVGWIEVFIARYLKSDDKMTATPPWFWPSPSDGRGASYNWNPFGTHLLSAVSWLLECQVSLRRQHDRLAFVISSWIAVNLFPTDPALRRPTTKMYLVVVYRCPVQRVMTSLPPKFQTLWGFPRSRHLHWPRLTTTRSHRAMWKHRHRLWRPPIAKAVSKNRFSHRTFQPDGSRFVEREQLLTAMVIIIHWSDCRIINTENIETSVKSEVKYIQRDHQVESFKFS